MAEREGGGPWGWQELVPVDWESYSGAVGVLSRFPTLKKGQHVRAKNRGGEWREGVVTLIWYGEEETINVDHGGTVISYYIACSMGDEMQVRWPS